MLAKFCEIKSTMLCHSFFAQFLPDASYSQLYTDAHAPRGGFATIPSKSARRDANFEMLPTTYYE